MNNPLFDIQDTVLERLRTRDIFRGAEVHWIARQEGRLLNDIDAGEANLRLACFVYPPLLGDANPNLPCIRITEATLRITWFEHYELTSNLSMHADRCAMETLKALHHWYPAGDSTLGLITVQASQPLEWQVTKQGLQQLDCWLQAPVTITI